MADEARTNDRWSKTFGFVFILLSTAFYRGNTEPKKEEEEGLDAGPVVSRQEVVGWLGTD